ncbi:MAG: M28 family peptidase [Saezia sp.]
MFILFILLIFILIVCGFALITQPLVQQIESTPPQVNVKQLEEHVRFFSETVYPRNYLQENNLNAAADYIANHFQNLGFEVEEQHFEAFGKSYRNIIARVGSKEGEVLVVGAHYDSFFNTPGADDNASGVAGLLELASLLKDNPPKHPVELVAYTLEEPPFFATPSMGSSIHARAITASGRPIKLMISLEMIGYFSDEAGSQTYPMGFLNWLYPDKGDFIGIIGRFSDGYHTRRVKALMQGATDLPVYSMNAPAFIHGVDFSDHRNYWHEGINGVMVTNTAFFRNFNYHHLTDTSATLDYERMGKVVQGVFAVVQGL